MSAARAPLVSFIVPTLNRGRYVVRAVDSCLRAQAETTGVAVEIIVVDSQSDDGSWEMLLERFAGDSRVRLIQNKRGLGPTRSWLDGAKLITGEFVTFVWSDDYISPRFLRVLLPLLVEGSELAIGSGAVRNVDEEGPFFIDRAEEHVDREAFLIGYFRRARHGTHRPVSPACAIFKRHCLDKWIHTVEVWCNATSLRQQVMWRRAIGPDLLLYLIASNMSQRIPMLSEEVVQFSLHDGSITVSSSEWLLHLGYWLARLWVIECGIAERPVRNEEFAEMVAFSLINGFRLAITGPRSLPGLDNLAAMKRAVLLETSKLLLIVRARGQVLAVIRAISILIQGVIASRVRSKIRGLPHG